MLRIGVISSVVALLLGAVMYFRVVPVTVLREQRYVGIETCRGCHATQALGNQVGIWEHSAHARSFAALLSDTAQSYALAHAVGNPDTASACLHCHVTTSAVPALEGVRSLHREEGVTCEACHGPSSDYSTYAAMRDAKVFVKLGGRRGTDRDCLSCHALSSSTPHCPVQFRPFVAAAAMQAIAHPAPRKNTGQ